MLDSARAIRSGEGELYVAGGVESMSRAPFVVGKPEAAYSRDFKVFDSTIGARFPNPRIVEQYGNDTMPETADHVAVEFGISREDSDRYAAASPPRRPAMPRRRPRASMRVRSCRSRCRRAARARR